MAENSQWRLPTLSDAQKSWLIDARASGMSFDEMTEHFRDVFPEYAPDIPADVFLEIFGYRIKQILNCSRSSAKMFLEAKKLGEFPINVEAIPVVQPHVRFLYYQRLWKIAEMFLNKDVERFKAGEEVAFRDCKDAFQELRYLLFGVEKLCKELGIEPEETLMYHSAEQLVELIDENEDVKEMWGNLNANTEQEE